MKYSDAQFRAPDAATFQQAAIGFGLMTQVEDESGNPIMVPVMGVSIDAGIPVAGYPEYHVNIRVNLNVFPEWQGELFMWFYEGDSTEPHKAENPIIRNGVTLLDNINSPARVWA